MDAPTIPFSPLFLGTTSHPYSAAQRDLVGVTGSSVTWTTANDAFYVPITIPFFYPVRRVWWINGTAAAGNTDFGIYTFDGTRIYSTGPTAGSGNSAPQFVTPAEFELSPGRYYFALSHSTVTANELSGSTAPTVSNLRQMGVLKQASAGTLPALATFATVTAAMYPLCGISKTASGF